MVESDQDEIERRGAPTFKRAPQVTSQSQSTQTACSVSIRRRFLVVISTTLSFTPFGSSLVPQTRMKLATTEKIPKEVA